MKCSISVTILRLLYSAEYETASTDDEAVSYSAEWKLLQQMMKQFQPVSQLINPQNCARSVPISYDY